MAKESRTLLFFQKLGAFIKGLFSVILTLFFIFLLFGSFSSNLPRGNIAVIPINGVISSSSVFGEVADSNKIIKWLFHANNSKEVKAVILDINSPGGSPVASAEIADVVSRIEKPVIAVIRETGASGAYWVASASDKIFAHPLSITGSIGVTASSLEFPGLISDYNISYRRLVAGKYKDAGSVFREMTSEETALFQGLLDKMYDEFVSSVAKNRNLPVSKVKELATGFVYLGIEAKSLGLVDALGTKQDAVDYVSSLINEPAELAEYKPRETLMDVLTQASSNVFFSFGQGVGSKLMQNNVMLE